MVQLLVAGAPLMLGRAAAPPRLRRCARTVKTARAESTGATTWCATRPRARAAAALTMLTWKATNTH